MNWDFAFINLVLSTKMFAFLKSNSVLGKQMNRLTGMNRICLGHERVLVCDVSPFHLIPTVAPALLP